MTQDDITLLIHRIRAGRDEEAAAHLWTAYYQRLLDVARRGLGDLPKRMADEEDVACSAMRSFFRAAENGRLNALKNRDELWKLLLTITIRKANRHKVRSMARKRGGGMADGESGFTNGNATDPDDLNSIVDDRFVADLMLDCGELISLLPNKTLQKIALQRLEGYTVEEIAAQRNVVASTIKRKLAHIREIWTDAGVGPDSESS